MKASSTMAKQPGKHYLLQLLVIIIFVLIYQLFGASNSIIYAAATYMVLAFAFRLIVLNHHREGMLCYRRSEYQTAVQEFNESVDLLMKYRWVDKYRYITMLSSQISFIEMGLLNIAFCYAQMGEKNQAKDYYIKTLAIFPDCQMAKDELKKLDAIRTNSPATE